MYLDVRVEQAFDAEFVGDKPKHDARRWQSPE